MPTIDLKYQILLTHIWHIKVRTHTWSIAATTSAANPPNLLYSAL